jgi:hypothetical protein
MKRALIPIAILAATATVSGAAYGLLGAARSSGTQSLTAATMPDGSQPTATVSENDVSLSWGANTLPGPTPMSGYLVFRHQGATSVPATGGCAGVVTETTCTETDVPTGVWEYGITPKFQNWTGPESARVTVEVFPTVTISNNPTAAEGQDLVYDVSLSFPSQMEATVAVRTVERFSSATAGEDYTAKTDTLVFAPGQTVQQFVVATANDTIDDLDSGFNGEFVWTEIVSATSAKMPSPNFTTNMGTNDAWGLGVILDDEAIPTITVSDATAVEGTPLNFLVRLSHGSDNVVTATIATDEGFSSAGQYTPRSATVTIPRHDTEETFAVQTLDDTVDESDATPLNGHAFVWTHMTASQHATLPPDFLGNTNEGDLWGLGHIFDND